MNSEMPQSQEFERYNKFRVELPYPKSLYKFLDPSYDVEQKTDKHPVRVMDPDGEYELVQKIPRRILTIALSDSEDELFSLIDVQAIIVGNYDKGRYYLTAALRYSDPNYQYWTNGQAEALQKLLTQKYDYSSYHHVGMDYHSLIIRDSNARLIYHLRLGYKDAEAALTNETERWNRELSRASELTHGIDINKTVALEAGDLLDTTLTEELLLKKLAQQELNDLRNNPSAINSPSSIEIRPIGDNPDNLLDNLFPGTIANLAENPRSRKVKNFTNTTKTWAKLIENVVNAMSKVKGIPQSGKLTLLPPSEIPQL